MYHSTLFVADLRELPVPTTSPTYANGKIRNNPESLKIKIFSIRKLLLKADFKISSKITLKFDKKDICQRTLTF